MASLWSEENPDAFAGIHSSYGVMLIMDEASGIPESIFSVSEGFFTEPTKDRYWFTFFLIQEEILVLSMKVLTVNKLLENSTKRQQNC